MKGTGEKPKGSQNQRVDRQIINAPYGIKLVHDGALVTQLGPERLLFITAHNARVESTSMWREVPMAPAMGVTLWADNLSYLLGGSEF
jgi:hypothetical protein